MEQSTAIFPNIIQSLDRLKILVFWEILKTKNVYLLDINAEPGKQYSKNEQDYIVETWERLYDDFYQLKNDGKTKIAIMEARNEMVLLHKINTLAKNVEFLGWLLSFSNDITPEQYVLYEARILSLFKSIEPRLRFKPMASVSENISVVDKAIRSLQSLYNRTKKKTEDKIDRQIENVYEVVAKVSYIVNMRLEVKDMVVSEWIAYEKMAIEKQKAEKEAQRNKKRK